MKLKNLLATSLIIFSIVTSSPKSYALFGAGDVVLDPSNLAQAVVDYGVQGAKLAKETLSSISVSSIQLKEYGWDEVAQIIAKHALKDMKKTTLNWVKGGYNGSPSFISSPESFFGNIATTELRGITYQLTNELRYANRSIAAQLIQNTRNEIKYKITPTVDTKIRNNICNETKADFLAEADALKFKDPAAYKRKLDAIAELCSGPMTEAKYEALKKCYKADFYCGGWDAFLAFTQEKANNDNARLLAAQEEFNRNKAKEEERVNKDIDRGGGFLSIQVCKKYTNDDEKLPCLEYEYTTPGGVASELVKGVVTSPIRQGELADEINEVLDVAVKGFIDGIANQGFKAIAGAVNNASNEVDEMLVDLNNDLSSTVDNYNSLPPAPTGGTQTQPGNLTNAERNRIVPPMIQAMKTTLTDHKKGGSAIQNEVAFYQGYVNFLSQIPQCYASKRAQEEQFIAQGDKPSPALIVIPNDVNQYLNVALANGQNKLSSLNAEYVEFQRSEKGLTDAIKFLETARNAMQIQAVFQAYTTDASAQKFQNEGTVAIRVSNNRETIENLNAEIQQVRGGPKPIAKDFLDACQDIDPSTYGYRRGPGGILIRDN